MLDLFHGIPQPSEHPTIARITIITPLVVQCNEWCTSSTGTTGAGKEKCASRKLAHFSWCFGPC